MADMIAYDSTLVQLGDRYYCGYAGRRNGKNFVYSEQDIRDMYKGAIKTVTAIPDALSAAMGNTMYLATFKTKEEMDKFYSDVLKTK